jgi:hypothetical protein
MPLQSSSSNVNWRQSRREFVLVSPQPPVADQVNMGTIMP